MRSSPQHVQQGRPVLDHVLDGPIEKLSRYEILICNSVRCGWQGPRPFAEILAAKLHAAGLTTEQVRVTRASCFGACAAAEAGRFSHLLIRPDKVLYRVQNEAELDEIIREHLLGGRPVEHLKVPGKTVGRKFLELYGDVAFFNRQSRVALRHNGVIDPESIEEYFHYRGLPGLGQGAGEERPAVGDRGNHPLEASRPRRRRISHGPKVEDGSGGCRHHALPHLQRRRGRPRARSWIAACWRAIR